MKYPKSAETVRPGAMEWVHNMETFDKDKRDNKYETILIRMGIAELNAAIRCDAPTYNALRDISFLIDKSKDQEFEIGHLSIENEWLKEKINELAKDIADMQEVLERGAY